MLSSQKEWTNSISTVLEVCFSLLLQDACIAGTPILTSCPQLGQRHNSVRDCGLLLLRVIVISFCIIFLHPGERDTNRQNSSTAACLSVPTLITIPALLQPRLRLRFVSRRGHPSAWQRPASRSTLGSVLLRLTLFTAHHPPFENDFAHKCAHQFSHYGWFCG